MTREHKVWAEGTVGSIAVFETEEAAKAYVKDTNVPIMELRVHGGESDG